MVHYVSSIGSSLCSCGRLHVWTSKDSVGGFMGEKVVQLGEAGSRDFRVHDQRVLLCVAQEIFSNDSGRRPNIVTGHTAVSFLFSE